MVSALADECLKGSVLRAVAARLTSATLASAASAGLMEAEDRAILDYAATLGLVVVTSDRRTMIGFAMDRVERGLPMPGLIVLPQSLALGVAIEQLAMVLECSRADEMDSNVKYLPL